MTTPRIIPCTTHTDERGFFKNVLEIKGSKSFLGVDVPDLLDVSVSYSSKGTFRGLHAQKEPHGQSKYIHVLQGEIIDLVYNPLTKKMLQFNLKENDGQILFVPEGYAHGFFAKKSTLLLYGICGSFYNPESSLSYSIYNMEKTLFPSKDYILKHITHITDKDKHGNIT